MTPRGDRATFRNEDLVLRVGTNVDPAVWDETKYEAFLDELCPNREYQRAAVQTVLRYLAGRAYPNLRELARENYASNAELERRYGSLAAMERNLSLPDQLSCTLDLATGTGKSYVLYGVAAILLAEGIVDRVLVLCPSNTIEAGLLDKFRTLAGDPNLRDLLPASAVIRTPRIINASETIVDGSICVENYHAILAHVRSSIRDSLKGSGQRVAVLNDEAHHVVSDTPTTERRWKEFLLDPDYGFPYILGVSGTCYQGDEYFHDVIYRYSLRQAIEERVVKDIRYVAEMPATSDPDEKWQLVYKHHAELKRRLMPRGIRPLTIVVTKAISGCKETAEELTEFLEKWEKIPAEVAADKVLPVTSAAEHQPNIAKLKTVDSPASPVEWIVSVSMLNEGWDVKNVFQIVPHEERAFNSKLLIAQVLGRGLRRPEDWIGADPVVTVFNHDAWSERIKHLVNEVLEKERRLYSLSRPESPYQFELHNLDYTREEDATEFAKVGEYRLLADGFVTLPTQLETEDVSIEFERPLAHERTTFKTTLVHKTYSIDEVAEHMFRRLQSIDDESKESPDPKDRTEYAKKFAFERCREIVEESLRRANIHSGQITEENRQRFLAALGTLRRKKAKRVVYRMKPEALRTVQTRDRQVESCSAAELRRGDRSIFFGPDCETTLPDEQVELFREVIDEDGEFPRSSAHRIENSHDFKTGVNLVVTDANPERQFVRRLCQRDNSVAVDAWFKNPPQRFYAIEYSWKKGGKGEHVKRGEFSPDFFLKKGDRRFAVEIKGDEEIKDPNVENQKKWEYASEHFARLNQWLERDGAPIRYQFTMLTPSDFNKFFQLLRQGELDGFRSELDVVLQAGSGSAAVL